MGAFWRDARRRQPAALDRPGEGRHPPRDGGRRQRGLGPLREDRGQAALEAPRRHVARASSSRWSTSATSPTPCRPERALERLRGLAPTRAEREAELRRDGYPAYTTSVGWLGYDDDKIRRLCREALAEGWTRFKLKVGADVDDDRRRARIVREEIGPDRDPGRRREPALGRRTRRSTGWTRLAEFDPYWIEEPTSPDDILGHATIARGVAPIRVATGEHVHNRVMFKQLLQAEAISVCQIDACRLGGVNEVLAVLLMAAEFGVPVCPHAGGVGLCELVQHLSIVDYVCVSRLARRPDDRVRRPPPRALRRSGRHPRCALRRARRGRATAPRCGRSRWRATASRTARSGAAIADEVAPPGSRRRPPARADDRPSLRAADQRAPGRDRGLRAPARRAWPGVLEQIRRSNIRNYSIFREGRSCSRYFEYVGDDFEADMAAMAADPETQRWWALTDAMQEPLPDREPGRGGRPCARSSTRTDGPAQAGAAHDLRLARAQVGVARLDDLVDEPQALVERRERATSWR